CPWGGGGRLWIAGLEWPDRMKQLACHSNGLSRLYGPPSEVRKVRTRNRKNGSCPEAHCLLCGV
ncbi:MAG: hypothetical protein AB2693_11820, partial [Candidatus Thiodiazotropha sp.]